MPALPKGIEDKIYSELKKIKNHYDKKKKEKDFDRGECEIKIKNLFIQVFVELFYDYMNYLTVIDDYPVNQLSYSFIDCWCVIHRSFHSWIMVVPQAPSRIKLPRLKHTDERQPPLLRVLL